MDFYEKALFVKSDVAAALCGMNANGLCPSRYASIRTSVSPLLCSSVHMMRSVLIRAKGAAIFRAVFLERWTKFAWRSHLMPEIRSAISGEISRGYPPL